MDKVEKCQSCRRRPVAYDIGIAWYSANCVFVEYRRLCKQCEYMTSGRALEAQRRFSAELRLKNEADGADTHACFSLDPEKHCEVPGCHRWEVASA